MKYFQAITSGIISDEGRPVYFIAGDYLCADLNPAPDALREITREDWIEAVKEHNDFWGKVRGDNG